MKPRCINTTAAEGTGSMKWWPSNIELSAGLYLMAKPPRARAKRMLALESIAGKSL
jgi:hypothetical protein